MSYKHFSRPVRIVVQQSCEFIIGSAWEAVEFMRGWPSAGTSRAFRIALQHCLDAIDGLLSARKAQASFVAAAREAGILADLRSFRHA